MFGSDTQYNGRITPDKSPPISIDIGVFPPNTLSGYIPICLDLDITNYSNKTINDIRAYFDVGIYGSAEFGSSDILSAHVYLQGINLLWSKTDLLDFISPLHTHNDTLSLRGGETRSVRLLVYQPIYTTSYDLSKEEIRADIDNFMKHRLEKFDVNLYISWV